MWTLVRFASHTLTVCDVFNLNLPILPAERKPILDLGPCGRPSLEVSRYKKRGQEKGIDSNDSQKLFT